MYEEELRRRGWDTWYHEDYWVHPKLIKDPSRQDYTNYGMSLEDALKFEGLEKKGQNDIAY